MTVSSYEFQSAIDCQCSEQHIGSRRGDVWSTMALAVVVALHGVYQHVLEHWSEVDVVEQLATVDCGCDRTLMLCNTPPYFKPGLGEGWML